MAKSRRLTQLLSRLDFLERNILPAQRLTGNYTKIERDLIKSFLLLAHAEIEAYLEDKVTEKVNKALDKWTTERKRSACLSAVLAFSGNELSYENVRKADSNNIEFRINRAVSHYLEAVSKLIKVVIGEALYESSQSESAFRSSSDSVHSLYSIADDY